MTMKEGPQAVALHVTLSEGRSFSGDPAFPIAFLACKLKPKPESHVVSLSYFFPLSVLSVLSVSFMSHSLQNLHQLKQIQTLKQMNEQLQAENRALTRVVARLSKSIESSDTQEL